NCGLLMPRLRMVFTTCIFLRKTSRGFFEWALEKVIHQRDLSSLSLHLSKKVSVLIHVYSKMMTAPSTCISAAYGMVSCRIGDQVILMPMISAQSRVKWPSVPGSPSLHQK